MFDYDLLRGYLHSRHLAWSYGAVRGREAEVWQSMIAEKPPPELLEALALSGFSGLYLDRYGYPDRAAKLEGELSVVLGSPPFESNNRRLSFFDLRQFARRLRAQYAPVEWEARREATLNPLLSVWRGSFSILERDGKGERRWCGREDELLLVNHSTYPKEVKLEPQLGGVSDSTVTIESSFFKERLMVRAGTPLARIFTLPPGKHSIRFHSDGRRSYPPNDYRELVFYVYNYSLAPAHAITFQEPLEDR